MSATAPAKAEFDQFAGNYDAALQQGLAVSGEGKQYFAEGRVNFLRSCLDKLKFRPRQVLDYGCGTGTSVPLLHALPGVEVVHGIDISPDSIAEAQKQVGQPGRTFATLDAFKPQGDVDLAFCNGVFHHIPLAERAAAVAMLWNAMRPGGLFAFWENNPWNPATRYVMSRIPFDKDAITLTPPESRRLLQGAGFDVLRTNFLFIFPRFLKWCRPLERVISRLPIGTQYQVLCRKPA